MGNLTSKVCLLEQATTKINVAVDNLPKFKCCKLGDPSSGPQHVGTIHIGSERFAISFVFVFKKFFCFALYTHTHMYVCWFIYMYLLIL